MSSDSETEQNSKPKVEQTLKPLTESIPPELEPVPGLNPPFNFANPMFGYCQDTKCPNKTTEKIGNYEA